MAKTEIHPSACIDPAAEIGAGCQIGPFAVVEADTVLGPGCEIAAHAVIKRFSILGTGNRVGEGGVIGGLPQDLKFKGVQSAVQIGDGNVFREYVTVNRSTIEGGSTRVGNDCFLMAYSHVAHECELGNRVVLANSVALAGHVRIEDFVFLSGGVVVHQFSRLGRLAMVGGNAKVEKDIPPFCLADGVPARLRGLNLVGLRRAGFSRETLADLKRAYRILTSSLPLKERLAALQELPSSEAHLLADFIRNSQRGICSTRE